MRELKITIGGNEVVLLFNYGFIRLLGDAWGCDGPVGVMTKFITAAGELVDAIANLDSTKEGAVQSFELPFDTIDMFADLIRISAKANGVALDSSLCADYVFENQPVMSDVIKLFMDAMPKSKTAEPGKMMPAAAN